MQLKRDTDYALRILLYIALQSSRNSSGMTAFELSRHTAVPPIIAARLCRTLTDTRFLTLKENMYALAKSARNKSLFDVICAVEGRCSLFAVFNKTEEAYTGCEADFDRVDQQVTSALKSLTLRQLTDVVKAAHSSD